MFSAFRAHHGRMRRLMALAVAAVLITLSTPAHAEPHTTVRYPSGSSATVFKGLAFDTCTAPSIASLKAWLASPYRAVGIYIGGETRTCKQPELSSAWTRQATSMGWKLLPIYKGRQPWCGARERDLKITAAGATTEGTAAGRDAVREAKLIGIRPGSAVYLDIEHYNASDSACRTAVLQFVSAYVKEMHRLGYLAGVYAHLNSGAKHLSAVYGSTTYARPDALWIARWDGNKALTGWAGIPDAQWANQQRAKQFQGDHLETHGGVTINIDSNSLNTPVATVAQGYKVVGTSSLNARSGPSTSYPVVKTWANGSSLAVMCQGRGQKVAATVVWNRLTDGSWVTDHYVSTPSSTSWSKPLPRCLYPFQTTSVDGLTMRTGPGASFSSSGRITYGSLAWVECQRLGSTVGPTRVWDRLHNGRWVTDRYVATPSSTGFSAPIPRCF
jgi:uncharacterized protein YraI